MVVKTLAELRTDVRRRVEMEDDGNFVSDAELNDYINESVHDLYDTIIDAGGARLFTISAPTLTSVGTNSFSLPYDFYRLVSVDVLVGGRYYEAKPADIKDYANLTQCPPTEQFTEYYLQKEFVSGDTFLFTFPSLSTTQIALRYIPLPAPLLADEDTVSFNNNWLQLVVTDAAIKCLDKEETDNSALVFRRQMAMQRVIDSVNDIDIAHTRTIRDQADKTFETWLWRDRF